MGGFASGLAASSRGSPKASVAPFPAGPRPLPGTTFKNAVLIQSSGLQQGLALVPPAGASGMPPPMRSRFFLLRSGKPPLTGGGKSLTFRIPSYWWERPLAVVIGEASLCWQTGREFFDNLVYRARVTYEFLRAARPFLQRVATRAREYFLCP